ncbi:hypothetical protein EmuJ_000730700 [Echinococcus multilocularis]|uniref:Uncharacterized protein n=1 Tax=Echinococcus multilocularis TaxID=6211 RepID=A0A068Y915_ECHMU|nr:hypothetical protein EmuJ_000730700 [Echinococcus multilocularis]
MVHNCHNHNVSQQVHLACNGFVIRSSGGSTETLTFSSGHWELVSKCFVVDSYPFSMAAFMPYSTEERTE